MSCQQNPVFQKFPADNRIWELDYSLFPEIANNGETISSISSVISDPVGLTIGPFAVASGGTAILVRITGGTIGQSYAVSATCNLSNGLDVLVGQIQITMLNV